MTRTLLAAGRYRLRQIGPAPWLGKEPWYRLGQLVLTTPVVLGIIQGVLTGYRPLSDDAFVGLMVLDIQHGHLLYMGPHTTAALTTAVDVYHPGPIYAYALALLSWPFGGSPLGLMVGSGIVVWAIALTGLAAARAVGGFWLALTTCWATLMTWWVLGAGALYRPFHPYPSAVGAAALALLAWAVLRGKLSFLPAYIVVGAIVVQSHVSAVPQVAFLSALLVIVGMVRWRRARDAWWPAKGWGRPPTRAGRRRTILAVVLTVVCFLGPLVEFVVNSPNNVSSAMAYLRSAPPGVGLGFAVPMVLSMASFFPPTHVLTASLLDYGPTLFLRPELGWGRYAIEGAITLGAVVAAYLFARARKLPLDAPKWGLITLFGSLAVQTLSLADAGDVVLKTSWEYIQIWGVIHQLWAVGLWILIRAARWGSRWAISSFGERRRVLTVVLGVVGSVLLAFLFSAVSPRWGDNAESRAMTAFMSSAKAKVAAADTVSPHPGHVLVSGDSFFSSLYAGWGAAYDLTLWGYRPHIMSWDRGVTDWDHRRDRSAPEGIVELRFVDKDDTEVRGAYLGEMELNNFARVRGYLTTKE